MYCDVNQIKVVDPLQLEVVFADRTRGRMAFQPAHLTGVFASLQNPDFFNQVRVNGGLLVGLVILIWLQMLCMRQFVNPGNGYCVNASSSFSLLQFLQRTLKRFNIGKAAIDRCKANVGHLI